MYYYRNNLQIKLHLETKIQTKTENNIIKNMALLKNIKLEVFMNIKLLKIIVLKMI